MILYGNFWIAVNALAMMLQGQYLLHHPLALDTLILFVFFATLFLYAVHRIVGISKLHEFFDVDRYAVIARYKHHIQVYAICGLIGMAYLFWFLKWSTQLALIIPGVLSLGYVLPLLKGNRKRLRDINHLKIFLIAIVWAWITVLLPALEYGINRPVFLLLMGLERALFIFAITLPFDIRDLKVDQHSAVKTLPSTIGAKRSRQLGLALLLLMGALVLFNFILGNYTVGNLAALWVSIGSTAFLLHYAHEDRHDYYYSGLLDGTMLIQAGLIALFSFL
ncbi:MAG: UbiA family prenyltransferase [Bacteroidota bacterium]